MLKKKMRQTKEEMERYKDECEEFNKRLQVEIMRREEVGCILKRVFRVVTHQLVEKQTFILRAFLPFLYSKWPTERDFANIFLNLKYIALSIDSESTFLSF